MAIDDERVGAQVDELRRLLERELEAGARPYQGCWPLAIAVLGVVLALVLLLGIRR